MISAFQILPTERQRTMEVNEGNLQTLAGYLQKTLATEPTERREAEKFLESIEGTQNYPLLLLGLINKEDVPMHLRVSAGITLKNYVKRNWRVAEDCTDKIHTNDRAILKETIVGLMLKSPEQIQKQLSDAISIIGSEDFPDKWPGLIQEMVSKFETGDFNVINGVLRTGHSLFKKYRHAFKSEKLWREIKFVLDNFAMPLTQLLNATMELAVVHAENAQALKVIYSSLLLICKIFNSLNTQDLPEFFEDNMETWMKHFHTLLMANVPLLNTNEKEEPGLMEQVKSEICDNVTLYAQKYEEEFAPSLPTFVNDIWQLLINTGVEVKYDMLVSSAIKFLACVAERTAYKPLFETPGTLSSICEKVIVPNMEFREADEEAFEDNPEEYIRRDIEGSDVDTRRRAACDLVRALSKTFEDTVIQNFSVYVQHMLQEYAKNPSKNWKNKDAAIYLVTSLAAKGKTQKLGITQTSSLVNVVEFFNNHIVPDLQATNVNDNPVLKADAIKYVMVFRTQLPRELLVASMGPLVNLLQANSQVIHSYAACCIEKILNFQVPGAGFAVTKTDLVPVEGQLLTNLFNALKLPGSQENEYVMKAIMRVLHVLQEDLVRHADGIIASLNEKLLMVSKNPSKPNFNHFLFEAICVTITVTCRVNTGAIAKFQEALMPIFQNILNQEVQEFIPYVFQVLSLLLEINPEGVSQPYMVLFPILLQPLLWENSGNVPALVRLLQAYVSKGAAHVESDKVNGLLGIFQKLLSSKANDQYGFHLLGTIITSLPSEMLSKYIHQIFLLIFQRLQSSKTTKYVKGVITFFCLFAIKYSASVLIQTIDRIQTNMFGMVLEKVIIADLPKVTDVADRKICAVGVTKILTEAPEMLQPNYVTFWPQLLLAVLTLLETPTNKDAVDANFEASVLPDLEESGFKTAYSQLYFATKKEFDPCSEITDVNLFIAKSLGALICANPNVRSMCSGLQPEALATLTRYFHHAGIAI